MGKSTLMNLLMRYNLAITNSRPQTTRKAIMGVLTDEERCTQIAFLDTPGVIEETAYALQDSMMTAVRGGLKSGDLLLVVTDVGATQPSSEEDAVLRGLQRTSRPIVVVVNKIDLLDPAERKSALDAAVKQWRELLPKAVCIVPISTKTGENVDTLRAVLLAGDDVPKAFRDLGRPIEGMFRDGNSTLSSEEAYKLLPQEPPMYELDALTDKNERFIASEIIREVLFSNLGAEVPYCCEVVVDGFTEAEDLRRITAYVVVDRESQKGILIGAGGSMIKELGTQARKVLEKEFNVKIMLDLSVKVDKGWRKDAKKLSKYGY
jgi:GTP-binding protein Era